ncbi:hypothetical protein ACO1O0_002921 [Amphichorda felina]
MEFKDLSTELQVLIFGNLGCRKATRALCNARRVCRRWNELATACLFQTITIKHPPDGDFERWNAMLDSHAIRKAARRVVIYSHPEDLSDRDLDVWNDWGDDGYYPAFTGAIGRIVDLPNITDLILRFSKNCWGVEQDLEQKVWGWEDCEIEITTTRLRTLEAVFEAVRKRATNHPDHSTIRSLTIKNLQNFPLPEFASSSLFKAVTESIDTLHLLVAEECNDASPDYDVECIERRTFEPFLHRGYLTPLADQLTSLTLYFGECWGTIPGFFDGKGLIFPRLRKLALGYFVISHHDHLDWVLAQSSLISLHLDTCYIVTYLKIGREHLEKWNMPLHDWVEFPDALGLDGAESDYEVCYTFSGTWETVFDRVHTSLPKLADFRFRHDKEGLCFLHPDLPRTTDLSKSRYVGFHSGLIPSPWIEAEANGNIPHALEDLDDLNAMSPQNQDIAKSIMNRSKENEGGDMRAYEALLRVTRERRSSVQAA